MTNDPATTEEIRTIRAASWVAKFMGQAAGLIVSLAGIAYYVGWRETSAYYSDLGAPWFVSMLSAEHFLRQGASLISVTALAAFLSILHVADRTTTRRGLHRIGSGLLIGGLVAVILGYWNPPWISHKVMQIAAQLAGVFWAAVGGIALGEIVASLATGRAYLLRARQLWAFYFFAYWALMSAPAQLGASRAHADAQLETTTLPPVAVNIAGFANPRLVAIAGDTALLVSLSDLPEQRRFRPVPLLGLDVRTPPPP